MPTETGTAFLVDAMGCKPTALSQDEFRDVKRLLDIRRTQWDSPLSDALGYLLYVGEKNPGMDAKTVLGHAINNFTTEMEDVIAILGSVGTQGIEFISHDEYLVLKDTLATIRAGGWFPDWLAIQVAVRADEKQHPDDRYGSPLRLAGTLVTCMTEFEERMADAREMVRMRPDLLFPKSQETPAPATASEPPAEPAKTQRTPKAKGKRHAA